MFSKFWSKMYNSNKTHNVNKHPKLFQVSKPFLCRYHPLGFSFAHHRILTHVHHCTVIKQQRIVYKRDNYIMHIGDRLPPNKRKTEAGGLGLCVDGTTCLHTYTVYICIMIPFYIWHWKTNCRVSHTLPHFLEEWPLIQTSLCKGFFFFVWGKEDA